MVGALISQFVASTAAAAAAVLLIILASCCYYYYLLSLALPFGHHFVIVSLSIVIRYYVSIGVLMRTSTFLPL